LALAEIGLAKALTYFSVPVSGLKARSYFAIAGLVIINPMRIISRIGCWCLPDKQAPTTASTPTTTRTTS